MACWVTYRSKEKSLWPHSRIQTQRLGPDAAVVSLSTVQQALWQLRLPVLDSGAVARYKKRAKLGMLWRAVCWQLAGMAALVAFECIGRQWRGAATVAAAAVVLAVLFSWLVSASELRWLTIDFGTYRTLHPVPEHR